MARKRQGEPAQDERAHNESASVTTDSAGRVPDTKGAVGFRGGRRPDARAGIESEAPERARPRNTGRQGS